MHGDFIRDWNLKKGRKLKNIVDFSNAKQGFKMAIKKSRYIEKNSVNYRIRTQEEVKAMIKRKKSANRKSKPMSIASSGYGSNESPFSVDSHCDEPISGTSDSPEDNCREMLLGDVFPALADNKAEFEKAWKEIESWVDRIQDEKSLEQNVLLNPLSTDASSGYGSIDVPCKVDPYYIADYNDPMCSTVNLPENNNDEILLDNAIADYDPSFEFEKMWKENTQLGCLDENVGGNSTVVPLYETIEWKKESNGIRVQCKLPSKELKANIPVGAAFLSDIIGIVANPDLLRLLEFYDVKPYKSNGCLLLFLSLKNPAEEHIEYTRQCLGTGEGYILCGIDHFIYCYNN